MYKVLFFDSETTDKINRNAPLHDLSQPHLVSLSAILVDLQTRQDLDIMGMLIKPEGFTIPREATEIHGITQEQALEVGLPLKTVLNLFNHFLYRADLAVAFNIEFDRSMVYIESMRLNMETYFREDRQQCAMLPCSERMKLPNPRGLGGWKWPTLMEAHEHFFKEKFTGAHTGRLDDVRAAARVWFELLDRQIVSLPNV